MNHITLIFITLSRVNSWAWNFCTTNWRHLINLFSLQALYLMPQARETCFFDNKHHSRTCLQRFSQPSIYTFTIHKFQEVFQMRKVSWSCPNMFRSTMQHMFLYFWVLQLPTYISLFRQNDKNKILFLNPIIIFLSFQKNYVVRLKFRHSEKATKIITCNSLLSFVLMEM